MVKKIFFLFVLVFSTSCVAQENVKVLSQDEFKKAISKGNVQLVDVRTPDEYKNGFIDHAINIDYMNKNFKKEISKLSKTKPVYVYCQAGGRSAKAASLFIDAGFKDVYDLKGGYGSWKK